MHMPMYMRKYTCTCAETSSALPASQGARDLPPVVASRGCKQWHARFFMVQDDVHQGCLHGGYTWVAEDVAINLDVQLRLPMTSS